MKNRWGILDQLRDNWPRQFEQSRIGLLQRKTGDFTIEELEVAVDTVLEECQYPPTVKDLVNACKKAKRIRLTKERTDAQEKKYRPGDVMDGDKTMTPAEARVELERMKRDHPEAFEKALPPAVNPVDTNASRKRLELMGHRIYVKALRKCASLDPQQDVTRATQEALF